MQTQPGRTSASQWTSVSAKQLGIAVMCLPIAVLPSNCVAAAGDQAPDVPGTGALAPASEAEEAGYQWNGTAYYVDAVHGDDARDGLSASSAWQTLERVNGFTGLMAGDAILLRRGCVWREQLNIPASGTEQHPILFSSYDEGSQPVINAAELVAEWSETEAPGVLTAQVGWVPLQVFQDGARLRNGEGAGGQVSVELAPGSWSFDEASGALFVAPRSGSATSQIEVSRHDAAIEGRGRDHIIVYDLAVTKAQRDGLSTNGGNHWVVDQVSATDNGGYGLKAGKGSEHVLFTASTARNNGIGFGGHDVSYLTISKSTTVDNLEVPNADGINVSWSDNVLLEHNLCSGNTNGASADGIQAAGCQGIVIRNNHVEDNGNAGIILTLTSEPSFGDIIGNSVKGAKLGIIVMADAGSTLVRGNRVHNNLEAAIKVSKVVGTADIQVFENVMLQAASGYCLSVLSTNNGSVVSDDNLFCTVGPKLVTWRGSVFTDLASYQAATGQDTSSIQKPGTLILGESLD